MSLTLGALMKFFLYTLTAQTPAGADPLSGGAGWVGAGLLGLVLGWLLLKHLPDKDRQIKELTIEHRASVEAVVANCSKEAQIERDASERRHMDVIAWLTKIYETGRESVHAVRNLQNSQQLRTRLADAVQSAEVPIWAKYLDGTLMSWNPACERLLGWRQGEIVGHSVYNRIVPPEHREQEENMLKRIANGETIEEYQTERVAKNGRRVPMSVVTSPIRDQTGRVVGASTTVTREL